MDPRTDPAAWRLAEARRYVTSLLEENRRHQVQTLTYGALLLIPAIISMVVAFSPAPSGIAICIAAPTVAMSLWGNRRFRSLRHQELHLLAMERGEDPELALVLYDEMQGRLR